MNDRYELWLLDASSIPLALIDSVVLSRDMNLQQEITWTAGLTCRESFYASVMQELDPGGSCAGDYLARYINQLAGNKPSAQWYYRLKDGSGLGLSGINIASGLEGRCMGVEAFPELLLRSEGHDKKHSQLIQEFLVWQAPCLLSLSGLGKNVRQELEQHARKQAEVVDKQYRLYPEVIDQSFIKAARVEAMLRKGQQQKIPQEDILSPFYIELHPPE